MYRCRPSSYASKHCPHLRGMLGHLDMTRNEMPQALNKGVAEFWNEAEAKENLRRTGTL